MKQSIELLAPGGDIDSIKAAIAAGADAVYCGLNTFNARTRATNIYYDELIALLNLAHSHDCKLFLTLNIIIVESELPAIINLLNKLVNSKIDGVIVQDLGLLYILSHHFNSLQVHASTQLTTHNEGQINFLKKLGARRVNLSRELNINEISALTATSHENKMATEVFVHGSYCIGFSGLCYFSSVHSGKSGNRGRCSQPCRDRYLTTPQGKDFPLNLKDNCAYQDLPQLADAGVDSIKIEGRIKKADYVYTVVRNWRKQLQRFYRDEELLSDNREFYKVFNRDFSNGYLKGDINSNLFIDNPRDHSIRQFSGVTSTSQNRELFEEKTNYYNDKKKLTATIQDATRNLHLTKTPLTIAVTGSLNTPLRVTVTDQKQSFTVSSRKNLEKSGTHTPANPGSNQASRQLNYHNLSQRFKTLNNAEYQIIDIELEGLQKDLFLPFQDLTRMRKKISFLLNDSKEIIGPISLPKAEKRDPQQNSPALSVLISSRQDLELCNNSSAEFFFELPNNLTNFLSEYTELFVNNSALIPWFPSILIGEDYRSALKLLHEVQPKRIVTNNSGVAHEASKIGISWVAGPYLNTVNSYSLICLQKQFNCDGAFISNELSHNQIKRIASPKNFNLYFSIYHPILLLVSRQCLFHQVTGCDKRKIDENCLRKCKKHTSITPSQGNRLYIEKTEGNYHTMYHGDNYLNTEIVSEIPAHFNSFAIDLRDIKTATTTTMDKIGLIKLFEKLLSGTPGSHRQLHDTIAPTTSVQYKKGI